MRSVRGMRLSGVGVKMGFVVGEMMAMDARHFMKRLRDLHKLIAENSANLKAAVAASNHEREAELRASISGLSDEIDRVKGGRNI